MILMYKAAPVGTDPMSLKFAFNEAKAIEALAYIASRHAGFTPFFVSKILFFAEKWHLNRYGRPIMADTYVAMPRGPVPSTVKNFIDGNWNWVEEPEGLAEAVSFQRNTGPARLNPGRREPNLDLLSESDIECLGEAIDFCACRTLGVLSNLTHFEKAWAEADPNQAMDYENFVDDDNPNKDEILEIARETAAYGVL